MSAPTANHTPKPLLRKRDMADWLDRSVTCIERDAAAGRIPPPIKLGGSVRWLRSTIEAWLDAGCPAVGA
jgi:predicted DNA-binding transcriptional regulator AlpA